MSTSDTPSNKTPAEVVDKTFTSTDIPITYNNKVLPSDSETNSHEYEWDSLASHESKEYSPGPLIDKIIEGEAWIKTFWDFDPKDTSQTDRLPPEPDYEEDSTDNDLDSSILTLTDASYELNLIDEEMPIIHPKLINWDQ